MKYLDVYLVMALYEDADHTEIVGAYTNEQRALGEIERLESNEYVRESWIEDVTVDCTGDKS